MDKYVIKNLNKNNFISTIYNKTLYITINIS